MRPTRALLNLTSSIRQSLNPSPDASSAAAIKANCRKIICIGRNYADHVKELKNPTPISPFFFLKPPTSLLLPKEGPIVRPRGVDLHHEVELGLVIGKRIKNLDARTPDADILQSSIAAYILSIDLTSRNVQGVAKKKGLPWTTAKGFDTFCPITSPFSVSQYPDPYSLHLSLSVTSPATASSPRPTSVVRQSDSVGLMLFRIPRVLSEISKVMTLEEGDIVLTGTPKGVGPLEGGQKVGVDVKEGGEMGKAIEAVATEWDVVDDTSEDGFVFEEQ